MFFEEFNTQPSTHIVLQEAVLAKHPTLLRCEDIIADILKYYQGNPLKFNGIDIDNKTFALGQALAKHFNFRTVSVTIPGLLSAVVAGAISAAQLRRKYPDSEHSDAAHVITTTMSIAVPNAYTFGKDIAASVRAFASSSPEQLVELKGGRYQWADQGKAPFVAVVLHPGLLTAPNITPGEVLSIILHELGHSFYNSSKVAAAIKVVNSVVLTLLTIASILCERLLLWQNAITDRLFPADSLTTRIFSAVYGVLNSIVFDVLSFFKYGRPSHRFAMFATNNNAEAASIYAQTVGRILQFLNIIALARFVPARMIRQFFAPMALFQNVMFDGLGEEKFADNFAVMHGYGENLAAALARMSNDNPYGRPEDNSGTVIFAHFNSTVRVMLSALDVHPSYDARALFMIDYLREEHKKAKTPAQKAFIAEQIKKVAEVSAPAIRQTTAAAKAQVAKELEAGNYGVPSLGVILDGIKSLYNVGTDAATFTSKIDANSKE